MAVNIPQRICFAVAARILNDTEFEATKGTRAQQVVDAIGIYRCEPGTGNATIPKANQSAKARIVADLENDRGARAGTGSAAFNVSSMTLVVVPQSRVSRYGRANHELVSWLLGAHRRFALWTSMSAAPMRRLSVRKPRNTHRDALGHNGRRTQ